MTQKKDKQLDDYLAGKDPLSSIYAQGEQPEPSELVDKRILEAARQSVGKKGKGLSPFSGSWFMPAALAAVLVLTVGIVFTLEDEVNPVRYQPEQYRANELQKAPAAAERKREESESLGVTQANDLKPAKKMKSDALKEERTSGAVEKQQAPALLLERDAVTAPALAPSPAPAVTQEEAPMEEAPPALPSAEPAVEADVMQSAPTELNDESAAGFSKPVLKTKDAAEPEGPETPERWLQSIRELIEQNKTEEARQQLADFRRIYPDYVLGEEFKALLN